MASSLNTHKQYPGRNIISGSASDPAAGWGVGGGASNMKSIWPPLVAIFMAYLYRAGGALPPRHPLDSLLQDWKEKWNVLILLWKTRMHSQWVAYRPLVDHIPACTVGGVPALGGYLPRYCPLWREWKTGAKILPCSKLRLRALISEPLNIINVSS